MLQKDKTSFVAESPKPPGTSASLPYASCPGSSCMGSSILTMMIRMTSGLSADN